MYMWIGIIFLVAIASYLAGIVKGMERAADEYAGIIEGYREVAEKSVDMLSKYELGE